MKIRTNRKKSDWPSWDLVYEWENQFLKGLNTRFSYNIGVKRYINKFLSITNFPSFLKRDYEFVWEMEAKSTNSCSNRPNLIPAIIDFHISKGGLKDFFLAYRNNPFILISSLEALSFLKENNFPKKIYHFPLSLADDHRIKPTTQFEKKYDLVLVGRQNPVLKEYLKKYADKNNDFVYVYRIMEGDFQAKNDASFNYYTSKGEFIGNINDRKGYIELIQKSKVGLYSTPGIDTREGFNQVTPRFLELIASGCHIIARYKDNPDTDFYQLNEFCLSINTYDEFEKKMNNVLKTPVDMKKYSDYLENHYTSKRVELLKTIFEQEGIKI
jgi:hypothetical protein